MLFWLNLPWEAGQSTVLGVPLTAKKASGLIPMSTTYLKASLINALMPKAFLRGEYVFAFLPTGFSAKRARANLFLKNVRSRRYMEIHFDPAKSDRQTDINCGTHTNFKIRRFSPGYHLTPYCCIPHDLHLHSDCESLTNKASSSIK